MGPKAPTSHTTDTDCTAWPLRVAVGRRQHDICFSQRLHYQFDVCRNVRVEAQAELAGGPGSAVAQFPRHTVGGFDFHENDGCAEFGQNGTGGGSCGTLTEFDHQRSGQKCFRGCHDDPLLCAAIDLLGHSKFG